MEIRKVHPVEQCPKTCLTAAKFFGAIRWYGCAPNVVNTFCAQYDWTGKKVIAFATSGGSPIGKTAEKLSPYVKGAACLEAVLVKDASQLANRSF